MKPSIIRFTDMEPGKTKTTSFIFDNIGGLYKKLRISKPDLWLKVLGSSAIGKDELPREVCISATGVDWRRFRIPSAPPFKPMSF